MAKTYLERLSESLQTPGAMGIQPDIPSEEEQFAIRESSAQSRGLSLLDPTGVGGYTLTFAQTEAGVRLAASLALETERISGQERLELENVLHSLAMDLLPPDDVETAMQQVRRGELVKSKLAFQAVLQNLADEAAHAERRKDIELAEENERRTLRDARARITIDTIGRDIGRGILYALGGSGGGE